ncbi:MAG TPA: hypothetical protein VJ952_01535, partial [Opitutales bacterium]|nr:hypothetical protein [Opitutales bacterium]
MIWKPGSADEVPGLSFGTNAFGTIAEAIANVDAGGTIFIAGGTYLEGAVLNIDKNLTLQGDGADATFLSGGSNGNNGPDAGEHRVLDISSASARVVINDLAIIDGQGNVTGGSSVTNNEGGGIRNLGILTVNRCVIARNVVALGGGIFNSGTLTLNDSELSSNRGSGLANDGTATINRSRFVNNFNFNAGGGIDNFSGSQMTINDSLISENTADRGAGANNGPDASMVLNNTEIRENSATKGAGICNLGGTVTLNRCLIDANTSSDEGGAGIYNEIGFVDTTSRLNVFDSVISGNTANRGNSTAFATGGGILNDQIARIERSEITGNQARYGGGIHNQGSGADLTVLDSNFDGNSATLGGGALRNDKTANVENCAFINNRANGEGGALFNVNYEIPLGGGSFLVFGADLNLTNCTLSNNTA